MGVVERIESVHNIFREMNVVKILFELGQCARIEQRRKTHLIDRILNSRTRFRRSVNVTLEGYLSRAPLDIRWEPQMLIRCWNMHRRFTMNKFVLSFVPVFLFFLTICDECTSIFFNPFGIPALLCGICMSPRTSTRSPILSSIFLEISLLSLSLSL